MDNRFHAVWAPEMHYIKSVKNWFIVACMNESAGGRGSFILRSKTGKPEGPYENIEGNKDKAIFPNIYGRHCLLCRAQPLYRPYETGYERICRGTENIEREKI